jgi:hypothetical protein
MTTFQIMIYILLPSIILYGVYNQLKERMYSKSNSRTLPGEVIYADTETYEHHITAGRSIGATILSKTYFRQRVVVKDSEGTTHEFLDNGYQSFEDLHEKGKYLNHKKGDNVTLYIISKVYSNSEEYDREVNIVEPNSSNT